MTKIETSRPILRSHLRKKEEVALIGCFSRRAITRVVPYISTLTPLTKLRLFVSSIHFDFGVLVEYE